MTDFIQVSPNRSTVHKNVRNNKMSDTGVNATQRNPKACWDRLLLRVSTDASFREKLLTSPNQVLLACGIELPANVKITVHEFDLNHQHIFLPPAGTPVAKPAVTRSSPTMKEAQEKTNG
jgi:hypothetical protein